MERHGRMDVLVLVGCSLSIVVYDIFGDSSAKQSCSILVYQAKWSEAK